MRQQKIVEESEEKIQVQKANLRHPSKEIF